MVMDIRKIKFQNYDLDKYLGAVLHYVDEVISENRNVEKIIKDLSKVLIKYQNKTTFLTVIEAIQSVLANITADFLTQLPKENREVMKIALDLLYRTKVIEYEKIYGKLERQKELGFR